MRRDFFSDECRKLEFNSAQAFNGKRLINHVIRVADVINEDFCMTLCYLEPNCVSCNIKIPENENGEHKCELNNSTHEGHESELEENVYQTMFIMELR